MVYNNRSKTGYISYSNSKFNYSYKGFCSIVCGLIDMALEHYIENDNFNIEIDEHQTLKLFENISPKTDQKYNVGEWWLERFFSNEIYQQQYNAHTPANVENIKIKNKVYTNILKIKDEYLEKFENKKIELNIDCDTLGVQIRGTDKKTELPELQLDHIFKSIDKLNKEKIFIATDDKFYLDALLDRYGNKIIYDNSITISDNQKSIHHNSSDRYKINEEVLSNVYLLSQCKYFLYSFSNVSLLALIMGINSFKFIDYLNK